jgi:hypothetical protein
MGEKRWRGGREGNGGGRKERRRMRMHTASQEPILGQNSDRIHEEYAN